MKVLFLLTQDLESPAGLGRYFPMARGLVGLGHEVSIAALHPNFPSLSQTNFEADGVQVHYVAPMHVLKRGNVKEYLPGYKLLPFTARATWALTIAGLSIEADIIHIGKPHPMNSIAGLVSKHLRERQIILDCDDYEAASGRFGSRWQRWVIALFENRMPHLVHLVTTNTFFMRARIIASGVPPEQVIYLPNGVDRERFTDVDLTQVQALRSELGLEDKKVVAFIGSMSRPSHPVDLLLRAFLRIRQVFPDAVLMLVGGGDAYHELQRQAEDMGLTQSTLFCGRVAPNQVPKYYRLACVSVDPIYDDDAARGRSPMKLFESWACGVPFATADVGDRRMLIGSPPAAALAHPGDPASLAETILRIISNPDEANMLQQRGRERIKAFYWDQLAIDLDRIYRTIQEGPSE